MTLVGDHPALAGAARLVLFAAQAVLFGLLPVVLLALRPGLQALPAGARPARVEVARRLQVTADLALAAAAIATVLGLVLQAGVLASVRRTSLDLDAVTATLATQVGRWQALRLPLLLALALVLRGPLRELALRGAGDGGAAPPRSFWWSWAALSLGLLATVSLTGHAVSERPAALHVAVDLVHLAAGAAWLAGVAVLASVLPVAVSGLPARQQTLVVARVAASFSRMARIAIPLVGATGLASSLPVLHDPSALRASSYGQALSVKVWLFAWVLAFGGWNHYRLVGRLAAAESDAAAGRLRRTLAISVTGELAFAALVLGATALLVAQPPPR